MSNKTIFATLIRISFIFAIIIIAIFIVSTFIESSETVTNNRILRKDGYEVLHNPKYLESQTLLETDVLARLPTGYTFIDYIYQIEGGALSTFHRDVTSSKHVYKTKHPIYTVIFYYYGGELLSVCPGSNQTYPFVWSSIINVSGEPGTAFIFDSDLLHAGCLNQCKKRKVVQYKVCHKDDLGKLSHLHGVRAEKKDKCRNSLYIQSMRKLSYFFEFPINFLLYPLMIKREDTGTLIGQIQTWIPITYYNNI